MDNTLTQISHNSYIEICKRSYCKECIKSAYLSVLFVKVIGIELGLAVIAVEAVLVQLFVGQRNVLGIGNGAQATRADD